MAPHSEDLPSNNRTDTDKKKYGKHGIQSNIDQHPLSLCFFEDSGYFSLITWEKGFSISCSPVLKNPINLGNSFWTLCSRCRLSESVRARKPPLSLQKYILSGCVSVVA